MKGLILAVLAAVTLSLVPHGAKAAEYPVRPLLSLERLSFSLGADRAWFQGDADKLPPKVADWEASVLGAYSLTKHLALAGSTRYALDGKYFTHRLGIRIALGAD